MTKPESKQPLMDPIKAARSIIEQLDIRSPSEIEVEAIAANRKAYVREDVIFGAEAKLSRVGNKAFITVSSTTTSLGRKRFSIGHELGHFELHKNSPVAYCTAADLDDWHSQKRKETEANQFSAELLMPEPLFRPRCLATPGLALLKSLSDDFKTSMTATAIQYIRFTLEPCALVFCCDGKIRWIKKNRDFTYYLKGLGEPVDGYSYAYDAFAGRLTSCDEGSVPASAWLKNRKFDSDAEIKESTQFIPSCNATLSLLWVNEEI
jgi:Zn-dependent peptidase ImmA (M78 family)